MTDNNDNNQMADLNTLRTRLRERLERAHASQRDVEEKAGWSAGYLTKLLKGERPIKAETLRVLAVALDAVSPPAAGEETLHDLTRGTFFTAILAAGDDDGFTVVMARLAAELEQVRGRLALAEAERSAAAERADEAERRCEELEVKLVDAEKRAAGAEVEREQHADLCKRAKATADRERERRVEGEATIAALRERVELPHPAGVRLEDVAYLIAIRNLGITDWEGYARYLEREKMRLQKELSGRPGWGAVAMTFLAGVGVAAAGGDTKKK